MSETSKSSLRKQFREVRKDWATADAVRFQANSQRVCKNAATLIPDQSVLCASYLNFGSEVSTQSLPSLRPNARWAYPKIQGQSLQFYVVNAATRFEKSSYGADEPVAESAEAVSLNDCDYVFVPGVAFDRQGSRMGSGQGFYDRALQNCPTPKIALCFNVQLSEEPLPQESTDVRMDFIATEAFLLRLEGV